MDKNTLPILNNAPCLKKATQAHVSQVRTWFTSNEQVLNWAGPSFVFPCSDANFEYQLNEGGFASFSFIMNTELIGFGQYQLHPPFLHLARLAIKPEHRGKGLASTLLTLLIEKGDEQAKIKSVSLFVYLNNKVAYRTYVNAGFTKTSFPSNKRSIEGCDYLTLTRK